jgi:putative transposase
MRADIFLDDDDRQVFIENLGRVCGRFQWRVWAWCLMDNHYHLLVETMEPTPEENPDCGGLSLD